MLWYKSGQLVYETDTSAVRDAKNSVEEIKFQMQIDEIDAQIRGYEKEKEVLQDLRAETEAYFQSILDSLQSYKDRWQELAQLESQAQSLALLKEFGISVEDITNMSDEAFEKFKTEYVNHLAEMNQGNDNFLTSLDDLAKSNGLQNYLSGVQGQVDKLADTHLDGLTEPLQNIAASTGEVSTNTATLAGTNLDGVNTGFSNLADSVKQVADNLGVSGEDSVATLVKAVQDLNEKKLDGITGEFEFLAQAIGNAALTLGVGEEGVVNTLISGINELNDISLEEGAIAQFTKLKDTIDTVTAAITGGGGGGESQSPSGGTGGGSDGGNAPTQGEGNDGGASGLNPAIANILPTTNEALGEAAGEDSEGSGAIGKMNEFRDAIIEAETHTQGVKAALDTIPGDYDAYVTIHVSVEGGDGYESKALGTVDVEGKMSKFLGAHTFTNAKYNGSAHSEGTAYASGDWGVHKGGRTLVGELGQELVNYCDFTQRCVLKILSNCWKAFRANLTTT